MRPDPAASYRHRTERQRATTERRYARDAAAVMARYEADHTAQTIEQRRARYERLLRAASVTLTTGTLKGEPLTPEGRGAVEAIAEEARTFLAGIVAEAVR